ncbi:regulator of V-ATPase in vacuolar membrane protein 1 [[Candida] jaroonii]|uniref:Regulator of V-ATPase in vacuolar membrane protein 1 n=1 Tax=[Candida] jaroonii TaxID=467808 RepID=A0ACA9Y9F9_9ASCO|nr:regulator of V-ATPase in vacuolar membrane protein 1 [[Candida] jaroonii]
MTINFIPGDVNQNSNSVVHGKWKNHYIIIYGSGNNLIISTITYRNNQYLKNLQTIYLEIDPTAIDFNDSNGFISISISNKVILYKPMNEFMVKPQWEELMVIAENSSFIHCLQFAPLENELIIGTDDSIVLYKLFRDNEVNVGQWTFARIWYQDQPLPVKTIKITYNANRILVKNDLFDGILKLWNRINYGFDNTLFELNYIPCKLGDFVVNFKWKFKEYNTKPLKITDKSITKIKDFRNFIDLDNYDCDTFFTFSQEQIFKIWATFEFSGHDHVKCWGELHLPGVANILLVDNVFIKDFVKEDYDLLLAFTNDTIKQYKVKNIAKIPHDNVSFELINEIPMDSNIFSPVNLNTGTKNAENVTTLEEYNDDKLSNDLDLGFIPTIIPSVSKFSEDQIVFPIHNRVKSTVKVNVINLRNLKITLMDKFQGHEKSIRKLIKSNPFYNKENILLSISNFPKNNYIWQPLVMNDPNKTIITKKFQIDLTLMDDNRSSMKVENGHIDENFHDNRIIDGVIINDIDESARRHHLVLIFDKLSYLSLWHCGVKDEVSEMLKKEKIEGHEDKPPLVFQLIEITQNEMFKEYLLIAIFQLNDIKGWRLKIFKNKLKIELKKCKIGSLPETQNLRIINRIETIVNQPEKSIISTIDDLGELRLYRIKVTNECIEWVETFKLNTNIKNSRKIVGSSVTNKLAIIDDSGKRLFIWDLKSEILEFQQEFEEVVKDIDWCLIESKNHGDNLLLSIGFQRHVLLFTELRYDYTNNLPTYSVLKRIDISDYTTHEIGDSIWINNGYLVIGCGNQFFIDDRWFKLGSSSSNLLNSQINQLLKGVEGEIFDISDIIKIVNGPLPIYHPQFLIQLLYMNEFNLVKKILVNLFKTLRQDLPITWNLNINFIKDIVLNKVEESHDEGDIFETFNHNLIELLINYLTKDPLPFITRHQQITLISIIKIIVIINKYHKSIDENGIRFIIGFKLFELSRQTKLNMRDIDFALHSRNQDMLFGFIEETYPKFNWESIKSLKLMYWIEDIKLKQIVEEMVRNEFNEKRDPSGMISLFYIALNRKKILINLWKTVSHKEKNKMISFLSNNFNENRWKVAAMKNAFVLLGQHRYLDAAYFFLLGDKLDDCLNIINSKLNDFELALTVSKLYQHSRDFNVKTDNKPLIEKYLIGPALEKGDKWINSWIYWEIGEFKISVDSLINPPLAIAEKYNVFNLPKDLDFKNSSNKFLNDDPALILLYKSMPSKYKSDVSDENNFLMKICKIYDKLGCNYLSLLLLHKWQFNYPLAEERAEFNVKVDKLPPQIAFEEPDMSSFDFGF